MIITVVRETLHEILQNASLFSSTKINDIKVLKSVLITAKKNGIVIQTTNMEESFKGEIGGKVENTGSALVDFKTFFELIRSLSETKVKLEKKEKFFQIISSSGKIKLPLLNEKEFPQLPLKEEGEVIDPKLFSPTLIEPLIFSCATDEARPILTGLCYDFSEKETRVVGTDGFRLSLLILKETFPFAKNEKIIVPARSLSSVLKIFPKGIETSHYLKTSRQIVIKGNGINLTIRLLQGEFPPYEKVIPSSNDTAVVFSREEFFQALRSVSLFARSGANMLILEINKKNLSLFSAGTGVGEAKLSIPLLSFEGKKNKITFNYRFLWDYLSVVKNKEIEFTMTDAFSPGVFKSKGKQASLHIIMPVRSQE